ncbi:MAG: hypothetical protein WCK62_06765 [Actinomycetes bacterium]|jgi:hypothetical protein
MILRYKTLWYWLIVLATTWNIVLSVFAVINSHWVLRHIAGGQMHSLSLPLRIYYFLLAIVSLAEIWFARKLIKLDGAWSFRTHRICSALTIAYGISTFVNLISRSSAERLNAPFAWMIAIGFYALSKRSATKN